MEKSPNDSCANQANAKRATKTICNILPSQNKLLSELVQRLHGTIVAVSEIYTKFERRKCVAVSLLIVRDFSKLKLGQAKLELSKLMCSTIKEIRKVSNE